MDLAVDIGSATMRIAIGREPVTVEVLPVTAGPLPWLGLDPGRFTAAGWDQPGTPADALASLLSLALDRVKAPDISSVTLAAPDPWWEDGAHRERALAVLRAVRGGVPVHFVPRTVAAAAWFAATEGWVAARFPGPGQAAGPAPERRLLVCDVGAQAVSASVLAVGAGRVTAVGGHTSGSAGEQPAGASFERALARAGIRDNGEVSRVNGGQRGGADRGPAVRQALRDGRRRAAVLLARAREDARYAEAPVYRLPGQPPEDILGRDVVGAFGPVAQTLRAVLGHQAIRQPLTAGRLDAILLTGGLGGFPETAPTVSQALLAAGITGAAPVRAAELTAAARGALLLRSGAVSFTATAGSAHLLVHRVRTGRLRSESLLLPADGGGTGSAGSRVPVQVDARAAGQGVLVEERGPAGTAWYAPAGDLPPAGRYEIGFWPTNTGGVLAFRPPDGDPVLVPLSARPHAGPGTGATTGQSSR